MNKTKKVLIVTLSLVAILSIFLTYKAYMNKPVMLDDIKYSENTINKKKFGIFVEKSSYSSEQDKYEIYSGTTWPGNGYEFNSTLSTCVDENGETISNALSINNSTITLTSTKTAYCYIYFDKGITWKYYGWDGSTLSDTPNTSRSRLRTSGTTALYSGINESDDIIQVCLIDIPVDFDYYDYVFLCVTPNSFSNNDLEEQCNSVPHLYGEGLSEYDSTFYSDSNQSSCVIERTISTGVSGGLSDCNIYSNGGVECCYEEDCCEISSSGVARCYKN